MDKIKILFFAANPFTTTQLRLDEEIRAITNNIRASEFRDQIEIQSAWATRADDLIKELNTYRPHIVHFSGHGNSDNEIITVGVDGKPHPISAQALKALFTTLKDNIRVVFLNACYSQTQAEAITSVIDYAIGMKIAIGDQAAIVFAASFYRAIGFGRSIKESFEQGVVALLLEGINEENVPQLLIRDSEGINPANTTLVDPLQRGKIERINIRSTEESSVKDIIPFAFDSYRPTYFTGRQTEIDFIKTAISNKRFIALVGMGGIGKTSLASEIVHQTKDLFPGGILWADFPSNEGNPLSILASWAQLCGYPELVNIPSVDIRAQVLQKSISSYIEKFGNVLIVFDDVRDTQSDKWLDAAHVLRQAIPRETPILLTTRQTNVAASLKADHILPLDILNTDSTINWIRFYLPNISEESAIELANLTGNLPLAIEIALGLAKFEKIDSVIESLRNPETRLNILRLDDADRKDDNIELSFSLSYRSLSPNLAQLYRALGIFSQGKIIQDWITGAKLYGLVQSKIDESSLEYGELMTLTRKGLLQKRDDDFCLHPLLRDYARVLLAENNENDVTSHAHETFFLNFVQENSEKNEIIHEAIENIFQAIRYANAQKKFSDICLFAELLASDGQYLYKHGYWEESKEILTYGLDASKSQEKWSLLALFLCDLGIYQRETGNYLIAKDLFEQSIKLCREQSNYYFLAKSLSNLGYLFLFERNHDKARSIFTESIKMGQKSNNPVAVGNSLIGIGRIEIGINNIDGARNYVMQGIEILRNTDAHRLLTLALRALADTYTLEKDYKNAISHYNDALDEAIKFKDLQSKAYILRGLGDAYQHVDLTSALKAYNEGEEIFRTLKDRAALAASLCGIGEVYLEMKKYDLAGFYFNDGLACSKEARWGARNKFGLARVKYEVNEKESSIKIAKEALQQLKSVGLTADTILIEEWLANKKII